MSINKGTVTQMFSWTNHGTYELTTKQGRSLCIDMESYFSEAQFNGKNKIEDNTWNVITIINSCYIMKKEKG